LPEDPIDDQREAEAEAVEEWLSNVASSEGISEGEVLDRMLSSYWILNELTGLMEETSEPAERFDRFPNVDASTGRESNLGDGDDVGDADLDLDRLSVLLPLLERADLGRPERDDRGGDATRYVESEIDRLHDDVDRLTTRIDNLLERGRPNAAPDADGGTDVSALEDRLETAADRLGDLEDRQRSERERIDRNFGNVEDVLRYLVDRVEVFDDRIDDLTDSLTVSGSEEDGDDRLARISRSAMEHSVTKASCGGCGATLDLALLTRAECPNCGRRLADLSVERRWFGLSADSTLQVSTRAPRSDADRDRPVEDADRAEATPPEPPAEVLDLVPDDDGPGTDDDRSWTSDGE